MAPVSTVSRDRQGPEMISITSSFFGLDIFCCSYLSLSELLPFMSLVVSPSSISRYFAFELRKRDLKYFSASLIFTRGNCRNEIPALAFAKLYNKSYHSTKSDITPCFASLQIRVFAFAFVRTALVTTPLIMDGRLCELYIYV